MSIFLGYLVCGVVASILTLWGFKKFSTDELSGEDAGWVIVLTMCFWFATVPLITCMIIGEYAAKWVNK